MEAKDPLYRRDYEIFQPADPAALDSLFEESSMH
jgi:hypothetical protein